ncbi:hypothetical protein FIBSPDRAFT_911176 [Athelia psychrophila]|uniref:PX domain-containing protein n=1 Tax=Athelia psychrophila TaxID=1759441 RepID=A0A166IV44_9AGAM|nr:hypothetical protein FIBSPDRAFT_911176 [Fibularhizoctonia sp. CBS 109695]
MFDPLSESPFANEPSASAWAQEPPAPTPTPPAEPNGDPTPPRTPSTPLPAPSDGLYGKEPRIYGQPEPGLISPERAVTSNGKTLAKPEPYLRVRITGLDRNRRDILLRLDAQTNLTNFTGTAYRNVSRSYLECQQFYEAIVHNNPQTMVPALPLAQTSAPTDEEDDRLVKIMLQRWLSRIAENAILLHDEDLRAFVESDFGYQPTPRPRRKGASGFGLMGRRGVPDEDEDLQRARFELTKLETQFFDAAKAIDRLAIARKSMSAVHSEMGNKLVNVATTEAHPPLANAFRKIGRTWHSLADLDQAQAISECVIVGDTLGYQGMNARSAKETLLMRTSVLEEYQAAVKTTITKRRNIERLKASSNIRPERVDEALEDMEEANKYEQTLSRRADGISQNLHVALQNHNRQANEDITTALVEHARSSLMYEKQLLRELEALRPDVANSAKKVVPQANGAPRPSYVPPLEDFSRAPAPRSASAAPPNTAAAHSPRGPLGSPTAAPISASQSFARPQGASSSQFGASSFARPQQTPVSPPSQVYAQPKTAQSPGAGPSSNPPASASMSFAQQQQDHGPLGGRIVDGTRSMFVAPPSSMSANASPLGPPVVASRSPLAASASPQFHSPSSQFNSPSSQFNTPSSQFNTPSSQFSTPSSQFNTPSASAQFTAPSHPAQSQFQSPLHAGGPLGRSTTLPISESPLTNGAPHAPVQAQAGGFDPLGQARPSYMTQSVRVTPTRSRMDAREAASKLANMF